MLNLLIVEDLPSSLKIFNNQ